MELNKEREEKLEKYRQLNKYAIRGEIVFAGSSLAEQFPIGELLNGYKTRYIVYNRGISGDTSEGLLDSIEECIFALEPIKIFINIGSNDISNNYSEDKLMRNYELILKQIQKTLPNTEIYILSYYPVNSLKNKDCPQRTNKTINNTNKRLASIATKHNYEYIDVNSILLDSKGELRDEYTTDGIHMLPDAYRNVLNILIEYF